MKHDWDLFLFVEDLYDEVRFRLRKAKNWKDRFQALLPVFAAVLIVLLLLSGIIRLGSFAGQKLFHGRPAREAALLQQETEAETEPARIYPERDMTLGCTGSMILHSPFITSYPDADGNYDFSSIYQFIKPYYSAPDLMTCEFEGTLSGPEVGYYGYPTFRSPDVIAKDIRDSGVDLQMLASNHVYDAGTASFHRTMDVYEENKIAYTGIRKDTLQKPYYIAEVNDICIGFLDYTYETTGSGVNLNGIPVAEEDGALINTFDYDNLPAFYQEVSDRIRFMKEDGARFIVLNIHWGTEYQLKESDIQREMAQKLCDLGVNALIGGHPHCEQPIDVFRRADGMGSMFCIFSLGNALSNQRAYLMSEMPDGHTEDGVLLTLSLHQSSDGRVSITGIDLLPTWVYRFTDNTSKYYILPLDQIDQLEKLTGREGFVNEAQASYDRTMAVLGPGLEKAREEFLK